MDTRPVALEKPLVAPSAPGPNPTPVEPSVKDQSGTSGGALNSGLRSEWEKVERQATSKNESQSDRYPALRSMSGTYLILSVLVGLATALFVLFTVLAMLQAGGGVFALMSAAASVPIMLVGFVVTISLRAMAESIKVVIDIEHSVRRSAYLQEQILRGMTTKNEE